MSSSSLVWLPWALGSAAFAALTAIFAKIGIEGVDSDVATWLRTLIIVVVLAMFLLATREWGGLVSKAASSASLIGQLRCCYSSRSSVGSV